ncbi:RIP metalloprotease RseP [Candidatus Beckwithbacteria bacterium]|nr:RIP metalloprotease RseP [Candidatus Beckwithbacteria bacterium]
MLPAIIIFLLVLSIVVLIHEIGHFLSAKIIGIKVNEFGFGYPPRIIGFYQNLKGKFKSVFWVKDVDKEAKSTIYSLNLLPFGGFVRLFGEQEEGSEKTTSKTAFYNRSKLERTIVMLAGIFMNLVLGVVCFSIIYSSVGIPETVDYITVQGISPNSPAQQAGIKLEDKILSIDEKQMTKTEDFVNYLKDKGGKEIIIAIERNGQKQVITLVPRENPPAGEGAVGVMVTNVDNVFYPAWQMPFRAAWVGIQETYTWTLLMIEGLGQMVTSILSGVAPQVAGPVGIYQMTSDAASAGILVLIKFIGILSINLAVVNALPFPALDGGRFLLLLIEKAKGSKINTKIEMYLNMIGMLFLIGLMILVTVLDVMRLVK